MWLEIGLAGLVGVDGVILTGLPVPSRELSPDFQAKARVSGFLKLWRAPREAGFTEQRFTSRSLRWKDNEPVLHRPNDASSAALNPTTTFSLFLFRAARLRFVHEFLTQNPLDWHKDLLNPCGHHHPRTCLTHHPPSHFLKGKAGSFAWS